MRRTNEEVKAELLKRRNMHFQKQARLRNGIISTVLCLAVLVGVWAAAITLPGGNNPSTPDDSGNGVIADTSSKGQLVSKEDGSSGTESNDASIGNSKDRYDTDQSSTELPNDSSEELDTSSTQPPESSVVDPPESSVVPEPPTPQRVEMIYPDLLSTGESLNLTKPLAFSGVNGMAADSTFVKASAYFAAELLKGCAEGQDNVVISPLSMMAALGMVYNGADGTTKTAMQKALGGLTVEQFNLYMHGYLNSLPNSEDCYLKASNALWVSDKYGINKYFLQDCVDYYDAEVYMAHFTDRTLGEINSWISKKTDGQIPEMLEQINTEALAYIINTLSFEALWRDEYESYEVFTGDFTNADGSVCKAELMCCFDWDGKYIEIDDATGFIKPYKNGYSFVALLPKDEQGLNAMVASMTGDKLVSAIENAFTPEYSIETYIPKFSTSCNVSSEKLENVLSDMGMGIAFSPTQANFGKMFKPSYIESVLHSTTITVDERSTKASSVTVLEPGPTAAPVYATVRLDRPFMYAIIDNQSNIPIFIGTVTDLSK